MGQGMRGEQVQKGTHQKVAAHKNSAKIISRRDDQEQTAPAHLICS